MDEYLNGRAGQRHDATAYQAGLWVFKGYTIATIVAHKVFTDMYRATVRCTSQGQALQLIFSKGTNKDCCDIKLGRQ